MIQRILFILILMVTVLVSGTASASDIDLSKALVIGNGPKKVIEFTDPDCPFCRKASAYFHNRHYITRYVFLNPLTMHPNARPKAQYILSGRDKARLYHEVMSGMVDRMDAQKSAGYCCRYKVTGRTAGPLRTRPVLIQHRPFMIMGRIIEGFDMLKIEGLLGK